MEMEVGVKDRCPNPRIINVKQHSSGADEIAFSFSALPFEGCDCYLVGDTFRQKLSMQDSRAVWNISEEFTKRSGCFDIQLELSADNRVWKSDVMLLIVSESTEGSVAAGGSGGLIGSAALLGEGYTDEGIIGIYAEVA